MLLLLKFNKFELLRLKFVFSFILRVLKFVWEFLVKFIVEFCLKVEMFWKLIWIFLVFKLSVV